MAAANRGTEHAGEVPGPRAAALKQKAFPLGRCPDPRWHLWFAKTVSGLT
jgi:hypothetical protein